MKYELDYARLSGDEFRDILAGIVDELTTEAILSYGDIYAALSEEFNNEVLEQWKESKTRGEDCIRNAVYEFLVDRLVARGFIDGVDVDGGTSLLDYGVLRNPDTDVLIVGRSHDGTFCNRFHLLTSASAETARDLLENQGEGFRSYVGEDADFSEAFVANRLAHVFQSIFSYGEFSWTADCSEMDLPELYDMLHPEENIMQVLREKFDIKVPG